MRYALLIYTGPDTGAGLSEDEQAAVTAEYMEIRSDPRVFDGAELHPGESASTVRVPNGKPLITDGPFAETKEILGGYFLVEADDLDGALELAARVPAARMGGSVEVRPIVER
jgi:hypothetical protein